MNKLMSQKVANTLKAIGHPMRLEIIELLNNKELTVSDIVAHLTAPQAIVSRHLGLMKDKGILDSRRDGTNIYYWIDNLNVTSLLNCIYSHCKPQEKV